MRIIKYTPQGTMRTLGLYSWDDLDRNMVGQDLRFRFRDSARDTENCAFLMDFDNMSRHEGERLLDMAYRVLGDVKMYSVFTGGGYHIYVPVEKGIGKDDYAGYKPSYEERMGGFMEWLPDKVKADVQPFNFHSTGRVPGSINSKRGTTVEYADFHEGPVLGGLDDVFDWTEPPAKRVYVDDGGASHWKPHKFCPFVVKGMQGGEEMKEYEMWKTVTGILAPSGRHAEARKLAEKTDRMDKVEGVLKNKDSFMYACGTIKKKYSEKMDGACDGCGHGKVWGSMPSYVSGPEPTPSASAGFHLTGKDGVNPTRIDVYSVVNHWSNLHRDTRLLVEGTLYGWTGKSYGKIGDLEAKGSLFPSRVVRELRDIPAQDIQNTGDLDACISRLRKGDSLRKVSAEDCDGTGYINMNNGILNLEDYIMEKHHPMYNMLNHVNMNYDENAKCPRFYEFLDEVLPEPDDQGLLQVFFGLAMSNIPCEKHEQCLWMHGGSGTGKTTIYRLLEMLLGDKLTKVGRRSLPFRENGISFDITGHSCVFFEDMKTDKLLARDVEEFVTSYLSTGTVSVRKLYKETFSGHPKGALIFTSNDAPEFASTQDGAFRRIRTLHFWKNPSNPDPYLMDKFRKEKDGIFLWALEGLKWYRENGMPGYSTGEKEARGTMKETVSDSMELWCEGVGYEPAQRTPVESLWQHFLRWSGENDVSYSKEKFSKRLRKYLPGKLDVPPGDIFRRNSDGRYLAVRPPERKRRDA